MIQKTDIEQDKLLQEAMERRAAKVPSLPDDFAEKVMAKFSARQHHHRRTIALWVSGVAAVLLVGFFLFLNRPKKQLVVTQKTQQTEKQEVPQPEPQNIEQENTASEVAKRHVLNRPTTRVKLANLTCNVEQLNVPCSEEPLAMVEETEQDASPSPSERAEERLEAEAIIPPDKQALADIFLAEEALQVAYQQQEQAELLRAYIISLEGEVPETSHCIISF